MSQALYLGSDCQDLHRLLQGVGQSPDDDKAVQQVYGYPMRPRHVRPAYLQQHFTMSSLVGLYGHTESAMVETHHPSRHAAQWQEHLKIAQ